MKILIAVNTCHYPAYIRRAQAQRETWVPALRAMGHDVMFFMGADPMRGDWNRAWDEVWFKDCDDSYAGICRKVQRICTWAKDQGYDYVLKVDDDVYIVPQRFQWLQLGGHDYVGRFRGPHGNYPPHFASGFAYWLSQVACRIVASTPHNGDWMDERFVATALAHRDIFGYTDLQNYIVSGPHLGVPQILGNPTLAKGTIFCEYNPVQMRALHAGLKDVQPVWPQAELKAVPTCDVTVHQLHARPCDTIPPGKLEKWKFL